MKRFFVKFCIPWLVILALSGCGREKAGNIMESEFDSDLEYVRDKGFLMIGVTDFEPLDYMQDGEWIGFDAEMAELFAERLGVSVQFLEIVWDKKASLLEDGTIDCVWNGMTLSDDVMQEMECTMPYLDNVQKIVVPKEHAEKLRTAEDCVHLLFASESGSAGEKELKERNYRYVSAESQKEALSYVDSGKADAAVIDVIMAGALVGDGKLFENLAVTGSLGSEELGIGFRKGSNLAEEWNSFWKETCKEGTAGKIAEKYGIQTLLVPIE